MNADSAGVHHGVCVERHAERVVARGREGGAGIQRVGENAGAGVDSASRMRAFALVIRGRRQVVGARVELHAKAQVAGIAHSGKTRGAGAAGASKWLHSRRVEAFYRRRALAGHDDSRPAQRERAAHIEVDLRHLSRRRTLDHDQVPVSGEEIHVDHQHGAAGEVRQIAAGMHRLGDPGLRGLVDVDRPDSAVAQIEIAVKMQSVQSGYVAANVHRRTAFDREGLEALHADCPSPRSGIKGQAVVAGPARQRHIEHAAGDIQAVVAGAETDAARHRRRSPDGDA